MDTGSLYWWGFGGGWTPGRTSNSVQGGSDGGRIHEGDRTIQDRSDGERIHGGDRRVQGGSDIGRSQGGDRRDSEQEEPDETQAAAMVVAHGGADGGRSHGGGRADNFRGATNGGGGGAQQSQRDGAMRHSRRSGVLSRWWDGDRPRESWRD
ncbi:hypothetical protein M9458_055796 [Cirrhinus mrigala]|uniref:Uncharacterized protein n=1 Tax=Cirrhinus mrigala TaxID=683832 RepID=A0ABD0MJR1_CIRMR